MSAHPPPVTDRLAAYGPGIVAAVMFACSDILTKFAFFSGTDAITMATVRNLIGLVLMAGWLAIGPVPTPLTAREKWIAYASGLLFAGLVYFIFLAIEALPVPIAILTFFTYPLMTGLVGAALGIEKLSAVAFGAAVVAFLGLAIMIGANPGDIAGFGIVAALAAMACRVSSLLVTRVYLFRADVRLTTLYATITMTMLFCAYSLVTLHWVPPTQPIGWLWLGLIGITTTLGLAAIFVSAARIGPFRAALVMNLQPLLGTLMSWAFLGEVLTPMQGVGAAVLLGAMAVFQIKR